MGINYRDLIWPQTNLKAIDEVIIVRPCDFDKTLKAYTFNKRYNKTWAQGKIIKNQTAQFSIKYTLYIIFVS